MSEKLKCCCICFDNIVFDKHITTCNHNFHKKCLSEWIHYNNTCPLCRMIIKQLKFINFITNTNYKTLI